MTLKEKAEKEAEKIPNLSRQELEALYRGMLLVYADMSERNREQYREIMEKAKIIGTLEGQLLSMGVTPVTRQGQAKVYMLNGIRVG